MAHPVAQLLPDRHPTLYFVQNATRGSPPSPSFWHAVLGWRVARSAAWARFSLLALADLSCNRGLVQNLGCPSSFPHPFDNNPPVQESAFPLAELAEGPDAIAHLN